MFTQIVFWLLLLFEGYGEVAWHTLDLMYWNGHIFLTPSTQYPVQEITNLEATAEVKIRYTDHLADGPWWLQAVCTCPSKWLVRMENFLLDWISGIKLKPKKWSDLYKIFSSIQPTRKIRVISCVWRGFVCLFNRRVEGTWDFCEGASEDITPPPKNMNVHLTTMLLWWTN